MKFAHLQNLAVLNLALSICLMVPGSLCQTASAATKDKSDKSAPAGTLLLPLTPKIDTSATDGSSHGASSPAVVTAAPKSSSSSSQSSRPSAVSSNTAKSTSPKTAANGSARPQSPVTAKTGAPSPAAPSPKPDNGTTTDATLQQDYTAESGDDATVVDENSLLKGTVQIVADDTEYDQNKNTFLGTGNAIAIIAGQDSRLEADSILYDQNSETIDARGSVKILRNGQLTTGSSFKFKVNSDEYLITDPDTELQGTTVVARTAYGDKDGLAFKKGTFTLPKPFTMMNNGGYGPTSEMERYMDINMHPDAYVPARGSYTFSAKKMVYEKYKEAGQLTVFGGKLKFDHFSIPLPHFQANVGADNSRVVFPVTAVAGNNMQVGGFNIGPQFNYAVGKTGAFSVAPLLQIGGRSLNAHGSVNNNSGMPGAGFKLGYSTDRLSTHIAYGSNSNLLVGDFKYRFSSKDKFQAGINRFLDDGFFGVRRARAIAEFVDMRTISSVPFLSSLNFRSSAGWAQDAPGLVDLSGSQYSQLFNQKTLKSKVCAYKVQEQITAKSHPIFAVGNDKYGVNMTIFGAAAIRAYSTGDRSTVAQFGPSINAKLGKFRIQGGYAQSKAAGASPFVFDQFIQGTRSTFMNGDVKLSKYLTVGTSLGYNLDAKMLYSRAFTAAIGPEDFKIVGRYDQISGFNRYGFNMIYGQPVAFDKLIMKGGPDAGQLGGI